MGEEPDPTKMPLEASAFPYEVQVAFFVLGLLPDRYEGATGTYMGKDWSSATFIFEAYKIEDVPTIVFFAKTYETMLVNKKAEEQKQRQKQAERRAKGGGRNTFQVTG